uniref:Uncharacterized protein n=1 Tax=Hemiselmis andersenii TaxID=464988 RepID=A0A6U4V4R2_HEMAN
MICITFMFFNTWMTQICDLPKQRNTLLSMATPARRYIASMIAFAVILLFGTMFSDPVSLLLGSPVNEPFVQATSSPNCPTTPSSCCAQYFSSRQSTTCCLSWAHKPLPPSGGLHCLHSLHFHGVQVHHAPLLRPALRI